MTEGICLKYCALSTFPNFFAFTEAIFLGPTLKYEFYTRQFEKFISNFPFNRLEINTLVHLPLLRLSIRLKYPSIMTKHFTSLSRPFMSF